VPATASAAKATKTNDMTTDDLLRESTQLARQGKTADALALMAKAAELAPNDTDIRHRLGNLQASANQFAEAEASQRKVLELDPRHFGALSRLAGILDMRAKFKEALELLQRAVAIKPNDAGVQYRLGVLLLKVVDLAGAEAACREAIRNDAEHLAAHRLLSSVLLRQEREHEAREQFRHAQRIGLRALPESLEAGLDGLRLRTREPRPDGAPATVPDRKTWTLEERLHWGRRASDLMSRWIYFNPQRLDAIGRFNTEPDWTALRAQVQAGTGAVLADSHVGLPLASMAALSRSGFDHKVVTTNGESLLAFPEQSTINARAADNHALLTKLIPYVKGGGLVWLAGDGGIGKRFRLFNYKGSAMRLAIGPPTLAFFAKVPIYWYSTVWREDRVVTTLELGPQLAKGEKLEPWYDRWFEFYCARLASALESGPENISVRQFQLFNAPPKKKAGKPVVAAADDSEE
jgi:Flp pilus assembly protein TadD